MKTRNDLLAALHEIHCTAEECAEVLAQHDSRPAQSIWDTAQDGSWMLWLAAKRCDQAVLPMLVGTCLDSIAWGLSTIDNPAKLAQTYFARAVGSDLTTPATAYAAVMEALHAVRYAHDIPQQAQAHATGVKALADAVRSMVPEVPL